MTTAELRSFARFVKMAVHSGRTERNRVRTGLAVGSAALLGGLGVAAWRGSTPYVRSVDSVTSWSQALDNRSDDLMFGERGPVTSEIERRRVVSEASRLSGSDKSTFGPVSVRRKGPAFLLEIVPEGTEDVIGRKAPTVVVGSLGPFSTGSENAVGMLDTLLSHPRVDRKPFTASETASLKSALEHVVERHRVNPLRWLARLRNGAMIR